MSVKLMGPPPVSLKNTNEPSSVRVLGNHSNPDFKIEMVVQCPENTVL